MRCLPGLLVVMFFILESLFIQPLKHLGSRPAGGRRIVRPETARRGEAYFFGWSVIEQYSCRSLMPCYAQPPNSIQCQRPWHPHPPKKTRVAGHRFVCASGRRGSRNHRRNAPLGSGALRSPAPTPPVSVFHARHIPRPMGSVGLKCF